MTFAMTWCVFLLDLVLGDPQWAPHPVRVIGFAIQRLEAWIRTWARKPAALRFGGVMMTGVVVVGAYAATWLLVWGFGALDEWLGIAAAVVLAYTTLAVRDLYKQSWAVVRALERGDIPLARKRLARIVGRDTDRLDATRILRAVIETVAENLSDGIVAPLFYLAIGGAPLAMAYKAASTLDSMVGYRDENYRYVGWCSARLDDVLNYIPARLTALLIVAAAFGLRGHAAGAWRVFLRDGGKHDSPNAGRPEAAMAGALGVQLGGPSVYHGREVSRPCIGDPLHTVTIGRARESEQLMFIASILMVSLASLVGLVR